MRFLEKALARAPRLRSEILSQSRVRVVICSFMGGYYSIFGIPNHPVYLVFALYSTALLLIAERSTSLSMVIPCLTLVFDSIFAICGLHVTGERGAFLLIFLVHFSFAYGIRYGRSYLVWSLAISCVGVTWLYWHSFPWRGHIHFLLSFLFGMPFISTYVYILTGQLRRSKENADANAEQSKQLLTFLAHDIRTPLHQLLVEIKNLQGAIFPVKIYPSLSHMESIVNLMARMCSGIIAVPSGGENGSSDYPPERVKSVLPTLDRGIVEIAELFRVQIESHKAVLRYKFSSETVSRICLDVSGVDRALLNIVSNASRYCGDGYVEIRTRMEPSGRGDMLIEVENCIAIDAGEEDTNLAENVKQSLFYGTSMGINSVRAVTTSAGGRASFQRLSDSRFLVTLRLPTIAPSHQMEAITLSPVVVISSDEKLVTECTQKLKASANVYRFHSIGSFVRHIGSLSDEVAAIFSEHPNAASAMESAKFEEFAASHGPIVTICSALKEVDEISIQGPRIMIGRGSGESTWVQAMKLSEELRLSMNVFVSKKNGGIGSLAKARILALDDNSVNLTLLSMGLQRYGLSIDSASSFQAGMRELSRKHYDILILDWNVGNSTALEFLHAVQKAPLGRLLKILILTAQSLDIKEIDLSIAENIRLVTKPVDSADILLAIRELWVGSTHPLIGSLKIRPRDLFFWESYMEMIGSDDSISSIDELLGRFLIGFSERVEELKSLGDAGENEDMIRTFHSLASMCYSVGAYSLGDVFKIHQDEYLSELAAGNWGWSSRVAGAGDLQKLTTVHIAVFRSSIRARRVS